MILQIHDLTWNSIIVGREKIKMYHIMDGLKYKLFNIVSLVPFIITNVVYVANGWEVIVQFDEHREIYARCGNQISLVGFPLVKKNKLVLLFTPA